MRLTRDESRERTRERLIEAARLAVARNGYAGTSIGDIAESAGFTKGAFFSNFESKEALLLELLRRHKADELEQLRGVINEARADGTMATALARYIDGLAGNHEWTLLDVELQLHAGRTPSFATRYAEMHHACRHDLGLLIAEFFARAGHALPASPDELAGLFLSMVTGLVLAARTEPDHPPFGAMVQLVLRSLLAAAPQTSTSAS